MSTMPLWMAAWLRPFSQVKLPASGDVNQVIAPVTTWFPFDIDINYEGDREIEREIERQVASNGKQLGKLNEVVLALAKKAPLPAQAMKDLAEMRQRIETIKATVLRDRAEVVLTALEEKDSRAHEELVAERSEKGKTAQPLASTGVSDGGAGKKRVPRTPRPAKASRPRGTKRGAKAPSRQRRGKAR